MNTVNPARYVVNFGKGKTGLSSVGFVLKGHDRTTDGVTELVPGTGIYGVTIDGIVTPGFILWDTGDIPLWYSVEDINIPLCNNIFESVNFGQTLSGLTNVGLTIAGTRFVTPELIPGSGIYGRVFTPPRGFRGPIIWDSGQGVSSTYAAGSINLEYELVYFFQTSSILMKKITDPVGKLELRGATGAIDEGGYLLIHDGGYLLLDSDGRIILRDT